MVADSANTKGPKKVRKSDNREVAPEHLNVVQIDQLVGEKETEVDYDLTDYTEHGDISIETPDLPTDNDNNEFENNDITISDGHSLIRRPGSEITITRGRKNLDRTHDERWNNEEFKEKRIIYPQMDNHDVLNAFREIRTNIIRQASDKNQVIMVVSLQNSMGATFCSVNLAAAFAYEGEKTALIIDCDYRSHKLEEVFSKEKIYGLTDYLEDDEIGTEDIIYPTGIRRLRYIPIGTRTSQMGEFFTSTRMDEFVSQIRRRYVDRYIILNAPPVEISADAAILSEICDQIVVVVPYGTVSNQRLMRALRLLPKSKITGIVLNNRIRNV